MQIEGVNLVPCGACNTSDQRLEALAGSSNRRIACNCGAAGPWEAGIARAAAAWNRMWRRPTGEDFISAFSDMNERYVQVLGRRILGEKRTAIGKAMGLTGERVRQLEQRAIELLTAILWGGRPR